MGKLKDVLDTWPYKVIRDKDLAQRLASTNDARYSIVKRALKDSTLLRLRRGLYLITEKLKTQRANDYALALYFYEPSFISLETALSFHGWIPESVHTTTSVSPKRAQIFTTSIGTFSYKHVSETAFYLGVERTTSLNEISFMAQPWRAVADYVYVNSKSWGSLADFEEDMRVDHFVIKKSSMQLLKDLVLSYPSVRVKKVLKVFLDELENKKSLKG